jgi:HSP20 family protein
MNNLLTNLTASPRAGRLSPIYDIISDFDNAFFAPYESLSTDNIRFNESKESFHVEIDLPGVKKEDLKVTLEDSTVFVEAKRSITSKTGTKEETFTRSFKVNKNEYNLSLLGAGITDGMLRIAVPRSEQKKAKVIEVAVS